MKFTAAVMAALAAVVSAVELTNSDYAIEAGKPFTLEWANADGPVTITLKNGDPGNLQTVEVIDSADTGTSFTWTPPDDLPTDTYAFEISDGSGTPNYSPQFQFQGTASPSSSGASSATSASETESATTTSASASETTTSSETTSTSAESSTTSASSSGSSSTSASSTTSSSASSTSASATATSTPENTNDSQRLGSPLAFVFVTIAALLYFN